MLGGVGVAEDIGVLRASPLVELRLLGPSLVLGPWLTAEVCADGGCCALFTIAWPREGLADALAGPLDDCPLFDVLQDGRLFSDPCVDEVAAAPKVTGAVAELAVPLAVAVVPLAAVPLAAELPGPAVERAMVGGVFGSGVTDSSRSRSALFSSDTESAYWSSTVLYLALLFSCSRSRCRC